MATTLWQDFKHQFLGSPSMATRLVAVNVIVFLLVNGVGMIGYVTQAGFTTDTLVSYIGLPAALPLLLHKPWTILSYAFTHVNIWHIVFNMIALYWFGNILSEFAGNKRVLPVYILGALIGGALFVITYNVLPVFRDAVYGPPLIGASAGVLALVTAAAALVPDYAIMLFLIGAVRLKWLALAFVLIDLVSIPWGNAGGHIAHLGGALFGYLYVSQLRRGRDLGRWIHETAEYAGNPQLRQQKKLRTVHRSPITINPTAVTKDAAKVEEQLDKILDKISQSGYDSLTKDEKDFLFRYSHNK